MEPSDSSNHSQLKLLVKGAHHPVWSPRYKRIAYLFNGDIWISDKKGNKAAALPGRASEHITAEKQVLQWSPDGKLYFTRQSPIWGTAVYVTPFLETTTVEETRQLYNFPFNLTYVIRPRKKPLEDHRFQPPQHLATLDWKNIQASNNATFSPDGGSVAMEIYPAGEQDIFYYQSSVHIYELISDSLNSEQLIEETETLVDPWFRYDEGTPRIKGPGRLLLPDITQTTIKPLWSPDGHNIAVTFLDTEDYSMFPLIAEPDGAMVTKITVPNFGEASMGELSGSEWKPIQAITSDEDTLKNKPQNLPCLEKQTLGQAMVNIYGCKKRLMGSA